MVLVSVEETVVVVVVVAGVALAVAVGVELVFVGNGRAVVPGVRVGICVGVGGWQSGGFPCVARPVESGGEGL